MAVAQDRRGRYCTIGEADAEGWLVAHGEFLLMEMLMEL